MELNQEIFCFTMDNQRYGFPLLSVDRLLQAVTIITVPNSPRLIHGLIDYYGSFVPVINFRHRLNLPERPVRASDYFVIVETQKRKLAIVIDDIVDVITPPAGDAVQVSSPDSGLGNMGFLRQHDGIVFIYDLEMFISGAEDEIMQKIIDNATT